MNKLKSWNGVIAVLAVLLGSLTMTSVQAGDDPEKEDLIFGFIKLTDMASLALAYKKGYFEDEGLYVQIQVQANPLGVTGSINGSLGKNARDRHYSYS